MHGFDQKNISTEQETPTWINAIMARYTYRQKLAVVFTIISVSIIILLWIIFSNLNQDIQFAELELKGNTYLRPVRNLIEQVSEHNLASSRIIAGDRLQTKKIEALEKAISSNFQTISEYNRNYANNLLTHPTDFQIRELNNLTDVELENKWDMIQKSALKNNMTNSNQMHVDLVDNLQLLLMYIGDTSNMSHDPMVETRYLMETSLVRLPEVQDLIAQLTAIGRKVIADNTLTDEDRYRLTFLVSLLQTSIDETKQSIKRAVVESRNINKSYVEQQSINTPLDNFTESVDDLITFTVTKLIQYHPGNGEDFTINQLDEAFNSLSVQAFSQGFNLWDVLLNQTDRLLNERISALRWQRFTIIGIFLASFLVSGLITWLIVKETNRFFTNTRAAVIRFAEGDLSSRTEPTYDKAFEEMRGLLNYLGDTIEDLIYQLQKSGVQLATSTTQIAAAAKHQEGTVFQQEATVKQILVTAGEISKTAKNFADTMNRVSKSAEETSSLATSGQEGLMQMEETMHTLVAASKNIASKLAVLNEKATAITSVITTITKVADQTNLLSLNAAIEAEKAGEHGKSFAVIAREIRRLADQVANATLDIEKMITEMMSAVSEGVMSVDKFSEEIRTGVAQVSTVSEQLNSIIEQVQQQTESFENVNKGMQTQSLGAEQINESIMQLSDAAQQTTTSIRQFHTAIEQLTMATKDMQSSVSKLKH